MTVKTATQRLMEAGKRPLHQELPEDYCRVLAETWLSAMKAAMEPWKKCDDKALSLVIAYANQEIPEMLFALERMMSEGRLLQEPRND